MMSTAFRITAAGVLILAACVPASAQDGLPYVIYSPDPKNDEWWAKSMACGGDVNLDGCDDLLLFDPMHENELGEQVGRCYMHSGVDGELLWTMDGLIPMARKSDFDTAMCGAFIGDINGDLCSELLVGVPGAGELESGYVALLSGVDGALIEAWFGDQRESWVGIDVAAAGDINADQVPDFAYIQDCTTTVVVRSGADFSILRTIHELLARRVRCAGDINGDNCVDLAVSHWCKYSYCDVYPTRVYSGQPDSEVLLELYPPKKDWNHEFGYSMSAGADITGDGVPDIAVSGGYEHVFIYSGATGRLETYVTEDGNDRTRQFGYYQAFVDINGDGRAELAVGSIPGTYYDLMGSIRYFDGAGQLISEVPCPGHVNLIGNLYGNMFAVGDLNGDGCSDTALCVTREYPVPHQMVVNVVGGGRLILTTPCGVVVARGQPCTFRIHGDSPGRSIYLLGSKAGNDCTFIDRLELCVDLSGPMRLLGAGVAGADRWASIETTVEDDADYGFRWLQAIDPNHPKHGPIKSNVWRVLVN